MNPLLEDILNNYYKKDMILFLKSHPENFEEVVKLAVSDNPQFSWRAAWLLWSCMDENDPRIHPYLDEIIGVIESKKEGHQRELFVILKKMKLTDIQMGKLFEICMNIYTNTHKKPSVRLIALRLLFQISKTYPELANELIYLAEPQYTETFSTAARKSVSKIIKIGIEKSK